MVILIEYNLKITKNNWVVYSFLRKLVRQRRTGVTSFRMQFEKMGSGSLGKLSGLRGSALNERGEIRNYLQTQKAKRDPMWMNLEKNNLAAKFPFQGILGKCMCLEIIKVYLISMFQHCSSNAVRNSLQTIGFLYYRKTLANQDLNWNFFNKSPLYNLSYFSLLIVLKREK